MNRFVLILLLASCGEKAQSVGAVVSVARQDLVFSSSFYGEIEAAESHPILAPEFRNVWQVTVEWVAPDGTQVKKGDTVLRFAAGAFESDLRERAAELLVSEANLLKTQETNEEEQINKQLAVRRSELAVDLAKLNVVEGVNLISKLDLEKARVELSRAELQLELDKKELATFLRKRVSTEEIERLKVKASKFKVDETKDQLQKIEVKAPADGMLYAPYTRLNWVMTKVAPGKVVRPGDRVLEIPELGKFRAAVYVRQRDASQVKVGDTARVVATMFPDRPMTGKVVSRDEFATTRNERTGSSGVQGTLKEIRVVLDLEGDVPLRPGGTVRADISTVLVKGALVAPLAALKEAKGVWSATRADGKTVQVKVGQTSLTHAEVLEGVTEGEELKLE